MERSKWLDTLTFCDVKKIDAIQCTPYVIPQWRPFDARLLEDVAVLLASRNGLALAICLSKPDLILRQRLEKPIFTMDSRLVHKRKS